MTDVSSRSATPGRSAADDVTARIRRMILDGGYAPGEHLGQDAIAAALRVSRHPVREALQRLVTEGTVVSDHNRGYFVAKMGAEDMRQVYLMRRLLETELVRSQPALGAAEAAALLAHNASIRAASEADDIPGIAAANRSFHFALFSRSRLELVCAEVERLWNISEQYRALYLYNLQARERIITEHEAIVRAIRTGELAAAVALLDEHRAAGENVVCALLAARATRH